MSFDRNALIGACRDHDRVARVVVAQVKGSAPREAGAAMLVWDGDFSGTIGGGTLEHEALRRAGTLLKIPQPRDTLTHHALGPDLGQCCGGSVVLLTEVYDLARAEALPGDLIVRGSGEMPLSAARCKADIRAGKIFPRPVLTEGWMIEPVHQPDRDVWIWGAGHVGRALVDVLSPVSHFNLCWADINDDRFPPTVPQNVTTLTARAPEHLMRYARPDAMHLIVTYSHALDLALCDAVLRRGFGFAGLIGSNSKRARFRKRLAGFGHSAEAIGRITCPIGAPSLGKAPHIIALSVAVDLIARHHQSASALEGRA